MNKQQKTAEQLTQLMQEELGHSLRMEAHPTKDGSFTIHVYGNDPAAVHAQQVSIDNLMDVFRQKYELVR